MDPDPDLDQIIKDPYPGCLTDPVAIESLLFVRPDPRVPKFNGFHVAGSGILLAAFFESGPLPVIPFVSMKEKNDKPD